MARQWVWGDKKVGYAVKKLKRIKRPWRSEVWYKNRIWRTDDWNTKDDAINYAKGRKRNFYGGKSAERVRREQFSR